VDSVELGALKRLEFLRSSPSEISGVRVVVDLKSDASEAARLEGCQIGLRSLDNLDEHTSFTCITSDSGLEQFGFVYLVQQDDSLPLFLPVDAVRELRAAHLDFGRKGIRVRRVGEVGPTEVDADSIRRAVARELERAAAELERASAEVERARQATPRPPESPAPAAKP
jgi:hypothetical protein